MGYYSDVVICVPEADYDEVQAHPESNICKYLHQNSRLDHTICSGINWTIIYFYDVKWYDIFDDVTAITNWYKGLPEYQFYCLGEDFGDYNEDNHSDEENLFYPEQTLSDNF